MSEPISTISDIEPRPNNLAQENPWLLAIIMGTAAGFLFGGYEFARSTATTLFKAAYGNDNLPVVMGLMPFGLIIALYLYGRLLSWKGARKALQITSILSSLGIFICYAAFQLGFKLSTGFLFILKDVYVVLLCEQYWSFMDSTLGSETAKKLNGPFCGIASIGPILSGYGVSLLSVPLGTANMLLFAAAAIIPATWFADLAYKKYGEPKPNINKAEGSTDHLGVSLFRAQPILISLLLIIIITQVVGTALELSFQGILQNQIPDIDLQNAFSGKFFAWVNGAAAFSQFILAPILLRAVPLALIHIFMPVVHLLTCAYLFFFPSLFSAGLAYLLFKAIDYSIFRAAKEILYIPLSFDVRYRAKELIDVFGYRFGKGGTSIAITLLKKGGIVFSNKSFAGFALATLVAWLLLVFPIVRSTRETKGQK